MPLLEEPSDELPVGDRLVAALAALASPVRLSLLRMIRTPKTLKEIKLRVPAEAEAGTPRDRVLSRQTVKEHLDRLVEISVVVAREAERDYGATVEYVVNHQVLYALSEEFRGLARLRPAEVPDVGTLQRGPESAAAAARRPCLVLVKGIEEGRTFDLRPPAAGRAEWIIGRRAGLAVSLDFDPFISAENARVAWDGERHGVEDLPESRNGTTLNFVPLPRGGRSELRHGDLIGVGRSLLLFRD